MSRAGGEVGPQVLDVLDADRQPHSDSGTAAASRGVPAAPLQRRLDAAEARRVHPQPGAAASALRRLGAARQLDGDDRAEAAHLRGARSCPGSCGRDGCRTRHRRVAASRRASSAAFARARSTRRCRVRSPRRASQASTGPGIAPCTVRCRCSRSASAVVGGDGRAEDDVGVAGRGTCHRVHDDVGAVVERPLHAGGGERVVDRDQRAGARGAAATSAGRSATSSSGVGRRLDPEQVGARGQRGADGVRVGDLDPTRRDPPAVSSAPSSVERAV